MKYLLSLLLLLLAGTAFAHSPQRRANTVSPQPAPTSLAEALRPATPQACTATQPASLLVAEVATASLGDVYCQKMLRCCDTGSASCCALFEKYCAGGD